MGLLKEIRKDYVTHGRKWSNLGFWAMVSYRFGRWSAERKFPPWRWLTRRLYGVTYKFCEIVTGVRMDRRVTVGERFHIVQAGMISIHPDVVFGDHCGVMHGVTIGTNMRPGVPVIGNDVFIGSGASVLGAIRVGDGARIAANSLVISDVPPGAMAIGVPAKTIKKLVPEGGPATKTAGAAGDGARTP
jgi:serine O-acetyltransferase